MYINDVWTNNNSQHKLCSYNDFIWYLIMMNIIYLLISDHRFLLLLPLCALFLLFELGYCQCLLIKPSEWLVATDRIVCVTKKRIEKIPESSEMNLWSHDFISRSVFCLFVLVSHVYDKYTVKYKSKSTFGSMINHRMPFSSHPNVSECWWWLYYTHNRHQEETKWMRWANTVNMNTTTVLVCELKQRNKHRDWIDKQNVILIDLNISGQETSFDLHS